MGDAGSSDAGPATEDAGESDAGPHPGDAGPADAGATMDAGHSTTDGGPPDAGSPPGDAGPADAGATMDAGHSTTDAGSGLDAGTCGNLGQACCTGASCTANGELMCNTSTVCVPDHQWTQWEPALPDEPPDSDYSVGNGTVTDSATGLMWQQSVPTNPCPATGSGACDWAGAQAYCQSLNGAAFGGFSTGWRLPEVTELNSLVNHGGSDPAIDTTAFTGAGPGYVWSNTVYATNNAFAWLVGFADGASNAGGVGDGYPVRCVR